MTDIKIKPGLDMIALTRATDEGWSKGIWYMSPLIGTCPPYLPPPRLSRRWATRTSVADSPPIIKLC